MQRLRAKKYGIFFFLIFLLFLCYKREGLNRHLSEMFWRQGGEIHANYTEDAEPLGEMMEGDVLRQRLYLETGALGVGVRFGTYIRENEGSYMLSVYDGEGNILGRAEIEASRIEDNQMAYIPIYSKIRAGQSYFLEVKALEAGPGNAVTCYGVEMEEGHEGAVWNGEDMGRELVTEVTYQKIFPIAECLAAACTVLFAFWLFLGEMKKIILSIGGAGGRILRRHGKNILLCAICVLMAGILLLVLFPKKVHAVIREGLPDESGSAAVGYDGPWKQDLTAAQRFDAVEVKFGTYMSDYKEGAVCIALYEAGSGELCWEEKIAAKKIKDNQFLRFPVGKDGLAAADYRMELWTEGFGEQPLALYVTADRESVVYRLSREGKEHRIPGILGLALLAVAAALCYLCLFTGWKARYKGLLVTALVGIAAGILLNTYANYKGISLPAIAKNLGLMGQAEEVSSISREQIEAVTKREVRYRSQGEIYSISDTICLDQVYGRVDTITIYFSEQGNLPITNTFSVYLDLGEGASANAEVHYEYAYKGQESICIPIKEAQEIKGIRMGVSLYSRGGWLVETAKEQWCVLEKIVLNESWPRFSAFSWTFFVGFLLAWVFYGWQRLHLEGRLARLEGRRNFEVWVFLVAASVFGGAMLFLMPAYQGPDEGAHQSHTFESIGAETALAEILEVTGSAVNGVVYNSGNRVDMEKYKESFTTYLSSYPDSFSIHLQILKYPGAAFGTMIGLLLHLPAGAVLLFGKLFALFLYIVLGALAIRIAPKWKELFLVILVLPVSMQQAASYSYDSFNNALALLCTSYLLHLILKKEKVSLADFAWLAGMLFPLLYIKKVYVLLGLLLLLVPYRKIAVAGWLQKQLDSRKKRLAAAAGAGMVLAAGCVLMLKVLPKWLGIEGMTDQLLSILSYPKEMCYLVGRTVTGHMQSWLKFFSTGFGWLEGLKAGWMIPLVFAEMFLAALSGGYKVPSEKGSCGWSLKKYVACAGLFFLIWTAVIFSMFEWTQLLWPVSGSVLNRLLVYETIEGVQGRYLIPIIALLFLFPKPERMESIVNRLPIKLCLLLGWIGMVAYTAENLLNRYWI